MSFLSHIHADMLHARFSRRGSLVPSDKAGEIPRGVHKEYPRMPQITLPHSAIDLKTPFENLLESRHSADKFHNATLSIEEWGSLLSVLRSHPNSVRRRYPSGGALYPIEVYVLGTAPGEMEGVFHYHPRNHALERLWDLPRDFTVSDLIIQDEGGCDSASIIILTSVWERSSAKYGDFTYNLALLEAGHMSQNILLGATALELAARPYAGFNVNNLNQVLDIDIYTEQGVLAIAIGK